MTATVSTLRPVPGSDGAIHAEPPTAQRAITGESWNVTLDVTGQVDLQKLARTIAADENLREAWRVLSHNRSDTAAGRDLRLSAANQIRRADTAQQAFTLTLGPTQAEDLAERLGELALEPQRCESFDGTCNVILTEDPKRLNEVAGHLLCPACLTDVDEHGMPEDRGSYADGA
jgi:hypothetical protein